MRIPQTIAVLLLFCTFGSLFWCADLCVSPNGMADEDCTCVLGALLSDHGSTGGGSIPSSPLSQTHESCRCLCQCLSLPAALYTVSMCAAPSPLADVVVMLIPSRLSKDILHPPRLA